jgi:hypothetical protein
MRDGRPVLYRLIPRCYGASREQIREHRAGTLEPALGEPAELVPGPRTTAGQIAGTFERVRHRARTRGGDLADGLASAGGADALLRELRQLRQTEADPAGVGAARGGRPARRRCPLVLGRGRRHGGPREDGCCGEGEQDTPGSVGTVRVGSHGLPRAASSPPIDTCARGARSHGRSRRGRKILAVITAARRPSARSTAIPCQPRPPLPLRPCAAAG